MIILTPQDTTGKNNLYNSVFAVALRVFLCGLFILVSPVLRAQTVNQNDQQTVRTEQAPAQEIETVTVALPTSQQMATAVATPEFRKTALLDLAVAARVVNRADEALKLGAAVDQVTLAQNFFDDRAWLQSIVDRYGWVQPHSSILDPAAWQLFDKLQQSGLENMPLLVPGYLPEDVLLYQVFQRAGLTLAVASLPNLLLQVETDVFSVWDAFLQLTSVDGSPDPAWKAVEIEWFTKRQMPPPPETETSAPNQPSTADNIPQAMSEIVSSAVDARPPDHNGLIRLRYKILNELSALAGDENVRARDQAKDAFYLIDMIDGLHDGRYFDFVQGLLSITSRLLEAPANPRESFSLVEWLVRELPAISVHYSANFASVDPHLNTALAASYDVLVKIAGFNKAEPASQSGETAKPAEESPDNQSTDEDNNHVADIRAARLVLADAVAQMALLIPDMAYYFDMPVRAKIVGEINNCIAKAADLDENGVSTLTRREFDTCMETLLQLADRETRVAELSGDMNGPFTGETLRRELSISPWQRINYGVGYLEERFSSGCLPPANVLPNPLEWSVLANIMSWFAEFTPAYFETTENENRISRMRNIGEEIIQAMVEQTECLAASGSGTGFDDLISRTLIDYEIDLRELDSGIGNAEADFRAQRLRPGADVALDKDATQKTAYRPDDFVIAPCDVRAVCEMSGNLSVTRALIGLFPNEYLVAEQTGMGHIEICYRNMEWVQRR
ncbi:MAG: hypothetical protein WBS20_17050, partial [Lysobacterales bacterium]